MMNSPGHPNLSSDKGDDVNIDLDKSNDDYDSGDDGIYREYFKRAQQARPGQLNLRKVTADFNNFVLEPKKASVS